QGWALVENTSDDDWNGVRVVLVSGRPISYQMNLYEPLYIPRPFVEPELFASLRPPVHSGALDGAGERPKIAVRQGWQNMQNQASMPEAGPVVDQAAPLRFRPAVPMMAATQQTPALPALPSPPYGGFPGVGNLGTTSQDGKYKYFSGLTPDGVPVEPGSQKLTY